MHRLLLALALGAFLCTAAVPVLAQQGTSEISGRVLDEQGGVLPGVAIVATNEDNGNVRETVSNADGSYFVGQIVPGRYRILAELQGFKNLDRRDIIVEVGRTRSIELILQLGGVAETVTVTAQGPLVDVTSPEVGRVILGEEFHELPMLTRSYFALAGSVPGVEFSTPTGFLNERMIANGQSIRGNNITVDGSQNNDDLLGSNAGGQARVAVEAIQELQLMTNQFEAEWGRASGGVLNAVTKSGTNQFHGSAFNYSTSSKITAKDYFARVNNFPKPTPRKQEWGGTIGGPIVRDKLHFFASLERIGLKRNQSRFFASAPELNFSNTDDVNAWNTLWRIDHQLNANHTWSFRWLREASPQYLVVVGNFTPETSGDEEDLDQTLGGTLTSVLGNTKVNTVRVGSTRELVDHYSVPFRASSHKDQTQLPPMLSYQSFNLQQRDTANVRTDYAYQIEDALSWFIPGKWGTHNTKFGARYTYTELDRTDAGNRNGTYTFSADLYRYDPADPRTYPERLSIRVPGESRLFMKSHNYEVFAQDKWEMRRGFTLSMGIRYDLEIFPLRELYNPLFPDPDKYPVDKNNVSPRLGFSWDPQGDGKSVVRGGYGIFYDKTLLGTLDNIILDAKFAPSFVALFPINTADPGPSRGQFPTDPTLLTGTVSTLTPEIRAYIDSLYPPGAARRNTAAVTWDDPTRVQPYFHQISLGYEREVLPGLSLSADYVRMLGRDLFLQRDLNIGSRINTSRTGRIEFTNPFGLLDDRYSGPVRTIGNLGSSEYDALNISVERRFADAWSARAAYTLSYARGNTLEQFDTTQFQVGTDLNLDQSWGPSDVDRRHRLNLSGRVEIPRTRLSVSGTARFMSGNPFTLHDTTFDVNQNGVLFDPLPAGTYSGTAPGSMQNVKYRGGRNGAYGPGFAQIDLRLGYRHPLGGSRNVDFFGEVFNLTNHANFVNPTTTVSGNIGADRRNAADFLRLRALVGTTGFPRQLQIGLRFGF